ncbi:MAG: very short patch repair endonuclease [Sulfurisoma sp.]|nr:very short patch repair endonuclease [Sulfurisoma sp.]
MDTLIPAERGERMSRVRSGNTKPEMAVRKLLFSMGYRYRLHDRKLPGKPDIVFPSRRKIVLVHGCFWHRHENCPLARIPKSHKAFWWPKLEGNRLRDGRVKAALRRMGWSVTTVWECQLGNMARVENKLRRFLESGGIVT